MFRMEHFKIEFVMKVTNVGQTSKSTDGRAFSDVMLRGVLDSATINNVDEYVAKILAGHMFGRVRVTIEPVTIEPVED